MNTRPEELNQRFGIPRVASIVSGNGGLAKVQITSAAADGEIYLHGAHVTAWKPAHRDEVLFVSAKARWEDGRAIRGGVPICFPWFGNNAVDPTAPAHGFVRTKAWTLESIDETDAGVAVTMSTASNEQTRAAWPADFRLVYRATFGAVLQLELTLTNTGNKALRFEEALHTYYRVADISHTRLSGLDRCRYRDKTDEGREKVQQGDVSFAGETDRVYLETPPTVEIADMAAGRRVRIDATDAPTTVVWNPWIDKAAALADLDDHEWTGFVCVETSAVGPHIVEVQPGRQQSMTARVTVAS